MTDLGNPVSPMMSANSVPALFVDRVQATPNKEAFRHLENGQWVSVTWRQARERVECLAAGLLALGIQPEQRVAIASTTRLEWLLADLAVLCVGAATTSVYPSTNAADTVYILADSEARILFAEDASQIAKLRNRRADLPHLDTVVTFDGACDEEGVVTLDDLVAIGAQHRAEHPSAVQNRIAATTPESLATLIYTSGTTGQPKGVRLLHETWVSQGRALAEMDLLRPDDLQLLWLPMSHAFGKALLSAQLACGFATAIDGRLDKIVENAAAIKPTFMAAVPRIFEKARASIITKHQAQGGAGAQLFDEAFSSGLAVSRRRREGRLVPAEMQLRQDELDRLVFSKVRDVFGGRIRFFISGAAPLNPDIAEWFQVAGLLIIEGYGMTETAGTGFVNHPDRYRFGTVGQPLPDMSVRIAEDGEVLLRGPMVMAGYHHLPEATATALTHEGWLHTGDKGALDAEGFLTITGRLKELFKTSGGKYVAPPAIEAKFMALCPYASQFMVYGAGRKYSIALITVDADVIGAWADEHAMSGTPYGKLVASAQVHQLIGEYVDKLNSQLNPWETIKKWALLDHDLSIERGELTPSLKVKRSAVAEQYQEIIDGLYR
jgi:long-chain acyl-CoA synthetase